MNNRSFLGNLPPVVKNLLAINVIFFLSAWVLPGVFARMGYTIDLNDILGLHYWESSHFNPAQLITYAFMHGGVMHIFFNMFGLYMFGNILEHVWGPKRFLLYYLVTAIGAAVIQQLVWTFEYHSLVSALNTAISDGTVNALIPFEGKLRTMLQFGDLAGARPEDIVAMKKMIFDSPEFITVGASGAIFGLLLAFGWLFPEQNLYLMFIPIPIKARIFVFLYGFFELFEGVANFTGDNVAHFAHLGGMLFGILLILYWKKQNRLYK